MKSSQQKTVIIGAGLTGLLLAQTLGAAAHVRIFDKARGVGGRLATRRSDVAKFDHGAQFYRPKEPLKDLHLRWLERGLVQHWFDDQGQAHFAAPGGMTTLAKDLAQNLDVVLNERVASLELSQQGWRLQFESGRTETADRVVFTSPIPQTLEILRSSGMTYEPSLDRIAYSKALVLLIENAPKPFQFEKQHYIEPTHGSLFSIADQLDKKVSAVPALTVTMNAEFSETNFDAPEPEVIEKILLELRGMSPGFEPGVTQLKKWRYCQVQNAHSQLFTEISPRLYLAGDGFGGASLNGAARSAHALGQHLLK